MKQLYTIFIAVLLGSFSFGQTVITARSSANWSGAATWDLNRVPKNNDSIVIPAGITVIINSAASVNNAGISVSGVLRLNGGSLTLNNNSTVVVETGGMISGSSVSDNLKIGNTYKFTGSESPILGAAYANSSTGASPNGFNSTSGTLPVTFVSFDALVTDRNVSLTWVTAQELNNNHFEVEKSSNGKDWTMISSISAAGSSVSPQTYRYTDVNIPASTTYYRIHQVDNGGTGSYSAVKMVNPASTASAAHIYSSSKQTICIDLKNATKNKVTVTVMSLDGRLQAQQHYSQVSGFVRVNLLPAPEGIYVVRVADGSGWSQTKKIAL